MSMPAENLYSPDPAEAAANGPKINSDTTHDAAPESQAVFKKAIKVIAIGGGGGNALNHIISHGIEGVDMLAVNTDIRSLEMSLCDNKIVLGEQVTKGLGAGAMPEVGARAAKESIGDIRAYLEGADMVYLTAGMGGGTGTGAIPIIAHAAKEMGILTVAVVTKPFSFEGRRRARYAEEGIEKLFPEVDALLVVPNDRLLDVSSRNTPITESFALADEILRQAVQGVTDLVTRPGMVNVDFADLKTIMKRAGRSVMGIGSANGEDCVVKAVKNALESPLMECSMCGAKGVLMNITYKNDLPLYEVSRAAAIVDEVVSEDVNFRWGCVCDPTIEHDVEVTVVAAGFDEMPAQDMRAPRQQHKQEREVRRLYSKEPRSFETHTKETFGRSEDRYNTYNEPVEEQSAEKEEFVRPFVSETHIPKWLLEEDKEEQTTEEEKPSLRKKKNVDIYEEPTFLRRRRHLKGSQH